MDGEMNGGTPTPAGGGAPSTGGGTVAPAGGGAPAPAVEGKPVGGTPTPAGSEKPTAGGSAPPAGGGTSPPAGGHAGASGAPAPAVGGKSPAAGEETLNEVLRRAGIVNPSTKKPVLTMQDLAQLGADKAKAQKAEFMRKHGLSEQQYDEMISGLPEVKEARELAQQQRVDAGKRRMQEQLQQINKLDPGIETMEDLVKSASFPAVKEMVTNGCGLRDAYLLANYERLVDEARRAGAQAERNRMAGKGHLTTTVPSGDGGVVVPEGTMRAYRSLYPGLSDAELTEKYKKTLK